MPAAVSTKPKSTKVAKPSTHPPCQQMIKKAIAELKEKSGSSRQAILKYIKANYTVDDKIDSHVKRALQSGVKKGLFTQPKGIGASGSFKLSEKKTETKPKKVAEKKTTVKKTSTTKKTKAPGTPKVKKAAKKTTTEKVAGDKAESKPKAPKAAKKPAGEKKPKTPKKAAAPKVKSAAKKATKPKAKTPVKKPKAKN